MPADDLPLRRFADRRVLVVGASTGIGLATARRVAAEGASVVVADLDGTACAEAVATLSGGGHRTAVVDVTWPLRSRSWRATTPRG